MILDSDSNLNEPDMIHDMCYLSKLGLHRLSIGGPNSEFYNFELDNFIQHVAIFLNYRESTGVLRQVGYLWINGLGVIDRVRIAAKAGADGTQFTYQSWEKMWFDECWEMLLDIAESVEGIPLINCYNLSGGLVHTAQDYNELLNLVPS